MSSLMIMLASLLSAIILFLFGMHLMEEGLENVARDKLKNFFNKALKNPVMGALVGALITAIIQSSTATTVMVIGFVNAGLMNLNQAVGVIIGANVGTTLTAHIMNIKISDYVPIFIAVGGLLYLFSKKEKTKEIGKILLGFGLLFMGLGAMTDSMKPLTQSDFFKDLILLLEGQVFLGILVGAAMTAIVQSSTASTAIIISLASAGAINLAVAIPIIFGMNIGTCLTAIISSISANKNAKKAALIHLLFSIFGTILFLPFINPLANLITNLGGELSQQIANTHTIFNVTTAVVVLPFSGLLIKLVNLIIKDDSTPPTINRLDQRFLETPAIAFDQAFQESLFMYDLARENLEIATHALMTGKIKKIKNLYENEAILNRSEREISSFLVSISTRHTSEVDTTRIASMIKVISDIERIGDHSKNIAELAQEASDSESKFTEEAIKELKLMLSYTLKAVEAAYESYKSNNPQKANDTIAIEERIDSLEELLRDKHIERLNQQVCSAHSGAIFLDAISNFERIGDHSVNIAESTLKSNLILQ